MTTGVTEAFDALYQAHLESGNKDLIAYPGATETELTQTEETMGFELTPELRELYAHVNGVGPFSFLPYDHGFPPLTSTKVPGLVDQRLQWFESLLSYQDPEFYDECFYSLPGAPSDPFLAFPGLMGLAVECGPIGTGAVMYLSDHHLEFFWVARSVTELFNKLVERHHRGVCFDDHGLFSGHAYGYSAEPDYGYWRWES